MGSIAEGDGDFVPHRRREARCCSLMIVYGRIYILIYLSELSSKPRQSLEMAMFSLPAIRCRC